MIKWFDKSINRKIASSYVVIFFMTYSLSALVIFTLISQTIKQTETETLTQVANQKMGQIVTTLNALDTNLSAWSRLEVMNDIFSVDVDKRISRTLAQLKSQYSLGGEIYVYNTSNLLVATSLATSESVSMPKNWQSNDRDIHFIDKHINPLNKLPSESEENDYIIVLSHKIYANFNITTQIGTIIITLPWSEVHNIICGDSLPTLLVNNQDNHIHHSCGGLEENVSDISSLKDKPAIVSLGKQSYISGYDNSQFDIAADWSILALRTVQDANAPLWDVARKLLLLGIILLIPVGLVIRYISLMLTRPLQSLKETVSRVARDKDLSIRAAVTTNDEIGILAHAFNDMAENLDISATEREYALEKLGTLNATLENRVLDRTRDLKGANDEMLKALEALKSTQSQLVQSEKMASLGQMVAGVAHELNNPIGYIYANFPHIKEYTAEVFQFLDEIKSLDMPDKLREELNNKISEHELDFIKEDLNNIVNSGLLGASRIKEIVASLRSFSRLDEGEMKEVIVERGIDDTLSILNHYLKGRIEVEKIYELNEPVQCRSGQINQVFTNIIYNAVQSIEGKGKLIISTRSVGDVAHIEISDTGSGIPEDIIENIFDPFFTTKKVGEGTGLGLSISYGIIESHGGTLSVSSELGQGTTFAIAIPKSASKDIKATGA